MFFLQSFEILSLTLSLPPSVRSISNQSIVDAEWKIIYDKLDACVKSGAQVILSRLPIGDLGTQYFADRGLFCAGREGLCQRSTEAFSALAESNGRIWNALPLPQAPRLKPPFVISSETVCSACAVSKRKRKRKRKRKTSNGNSGSKRQADRWIEVRDMSCVNGTIAFRCILCRINTYGSK